MIDQKFPFLEPSRGKFQCKCGQIISRVIFPRRVIDSSVKNRKVFCAKGTQYGPGRLDIQYPCTDKIDFINNDGNRPMVVGFMTLDPV